MFGIDKPVINGDTNKNGNDGFGHRHCIDIAPITRI